MKKLSKLGKIALTSVLSATLLSGCATSALLKKDSGGTYTTTQKRVLTNDVVVAFGKPSLKLPNIPSDAVVIVGQRNSYVLVEGGTRFNNLITRLDPRHISLTKGLDFYSANNDGSFTGELAFKYTKLKAEVTNEELNFFLQNGVKECTNHSESNLGAQSYCFDIPLKGHTYPAVSNQSSLKALSKAYPVTIYTNEQTTAYREGQSSSVEKLVLFPFAAAFDVVTLPLQIIGQIFD